LNVAEADLFIEALGSLPPSTGTEHML